MSNDDQPYALLEHEAYWRDIYPWLLEQGYRLRPRYTPGWVPSWKTDNTVRPALAEDSQATSFESVMDATRLKDNAVVVLKRVVKSKSPEEVEILRYFSQEPQASDPRNHAISLIEVLQPSNVDETIVVLPLLRPYDKPDFDTVGEGLDFIHQILEGFAFLHQHHVAHRDVRSENLMLDAKNLYSQQPHPWKYSSNYEYTGLIRPRFSRTEQPSRYYIIDFGFSKQYSPEEMPPSELPKLASDLTVPEFFDQTTPADPFPIDVYTVGHLLLTDFIEGNPTSANQKGREGFEFLSPLITAMTKHDPTKRITMEEAVVKFAEIVQGLSSWKLRSRAIRIPGGNIGYDDFLTRLQLSAEYWGRRIKYVARRLPPIPKAPSVEAPKPGD